jgi:hypothetical protein
LEALAEHEPQPPQFIIPDWLPCGYATLLAGHGGVGKSMIALYVAVCIAAGAPFFGLEVQRRRVLFISCEDRTDVLHWRLKRICVHLGIEMASVPSYALAGLLKGRRQSSEAALQYAVYGAGTAGGGASGGACAGASASSSADPAGMSGGTCAQLVTPHTPHSNPRSTNPDRTHCIVPRTTGLTTGYCT